MQIICSAAGCKFKTPLGLGYDLKEMLEMMNMHEQLVHQPPVRGSGDTKIEEGILKKDLMSLLECPVCLDVFKPPLQVFNYCLLSAYPLSLFLQDMAMSRGPCHLWEMQSQD